MAEVPYNTIRFKINGDYGFINVSSEIDLQKAEIIIKNECRELNLNLEDISFSKGDNFYSPSSILDEDGIRNFFKKKAIISQPNSPGNLSGIDALYAEIIRHHR